MNWSRLKTTSAILKKRNLTIAEVADGLGINISDLSDVISEKKVEVPNWL